MKKGICTICLLLIVGGYTELVQPVQRIPFPIEEYQKLPKMGTGTATVRGQAFLKMEGGDVLHAAGKEIHLLPITSYSNQWYREAVLSNRPMAKHDPRYEQYTTTTIGDGEGRFEFKNVPAGNYYLSTFVVYAYIAGRGYSYPTGGNIVKKISVENGQELKIILTR